MGKSTISTGPFSMAIFHGYVSSPEGKITITDADLHFEEMNNQPVYQPHSCGDTHQVTESQQTSLDRNSCDHDENQNINSLG